MALVFTLCQICFEAWAKLAQQWLVCEPLGIHLEQINKELILLVTIYIIIINCVTGHRPTAHIAHHWPKENCAVPNKKLFGPMVCYMSLSKTLLYAYGVSLWFSYKPTPQVLLPPPDHHMCTASMNPYCVNNTTLSGRK